MANLETNPQANIATGNVNNGELSTSSDANPPLEEWMITEDRFEEHAIAVEESLSSLDRLLDELAGIENHDPDSEEYDYTGHRRVHRAFVQLAQADTNATSQDAGPNAQAELDRAVAEVEISIQDFIDFHQARREAPSPPTATATSAESRRPRRRAARARRREARPSYTENFITAFVIGARSGPLQLRVSEERLDWGDPLPESLGFIEMLDFPPPFALPPLPASLPSSNHRRPRTSHTGRVLEGHSLADFFIPWQEPEVVDRW